MSTSAEIVEAVRPLLAEARGIYAEILSIEEAVKGHFDLLYVASWKFGHVLSRMKEQVGHGKWLFFLGANWPDLGIRTAQRCMAFFDENPLDGSNTSVPTHFSIDSIRKLLGGYVPAKERPELPGDQAIPPARHHLTAVNQLATFVRRREIGLIPKAEVEALRRDFEQPLRNLIAILGPEWVTAQILES